MSNENLKSVFEPPRPASAPSETEEHAQRANPRNEPESEVDRLPQIMHLIIPDNTSPPLVADAPPCEYLKRQPLGRGAYAETFLVERVSDGERCAAKIMNLCSMDRKSRSYAFCEMGCLASCDHFAILKHYKSSLIDACTEAIVMEYANGGTLRAALMREPPAFSERDIGRMFVQLMCAVDHIHSRRMIHRDIKTANIMLTNTELVKLGDFGFSKRNEDSISGDFAHSFLGTPYNMAPEMWKQHPYGKRADIWACGIVLYEALTRKHPFTGSSMKELGEAIIAGKYEPLPDTVSPDMKDLLEFILQINSKARPTAKMILQLPIMQRYLEEFRRAVKRSTSLGEADRERILVQVAQTTAAQPEPSAVPSCEGLVYKMSAGKWKPRRLCLSNGYLFLSLPKTDHSGEDATHSKKVDISLLTSVVPLPSVQLDESRTIYPFAINTKLRSIIVVGCTTQSDQSRWIHALLSVLQMGL